MRGSQNADVTGGTTKDRWPKYGDVERTRSVSTKTEASSVDSPQLAVVRETSDVDASSSETPLRELVQQLVDERMSDARAERHELKKEARWMGVRVLTLEQTLKKCRDENKALSEYLQLCFDEIRSQDDRLSPRLAAVEAEMLALSSRASRTDIENIELRQETREAISKIDSLETELFELIYEAKSVAVQARGSADAVAVQADEIVLDLREAHEQVVKLEGRTSSISIELEETIEAAEFLVSGLTDAASASVRAHAVAEEARAHAVDASGLSDELRADLERRTKALRKEISRKAETEDVTALEEADRALEEGLKSATELAEEVRVLAEKAADRADYAAESSDEIRADLEELGDGVANDLDDIRTDMDNKTGDLAKGARELRGDLVERTDQLRNDLIDRTASLRVEFEERSGAAQDEVAMHDLRAEVAESLDALRLRVDERLNGYTVRAADSPEGPRKRWHAHLRKNNDSDDSPKALPSET